MNHRKHRSLILHHNRQLNGLKQPRIAPSKSNVGANKKCAKCWMVFRKLVTANNLTQRAIIFLKKGRKNTLYIIYNYIIINILHDLSCSISLTCFFDLLFRAPTQKKNNNT